MEEGQVRVKEGPAHPLPLFLSNVEEEKDEEEERGQIPGRSGGWSE